MSDVQNNDCQREGPKHRATSPPPLPSKQTTAAATVAKQATSASSSDEAAHHHRHHAESVLEHHHSDAHLTKEATWLCGYPLPPVPGIPSPEAAMWPTFHNPLAPDEPPGLSHDEEYKIAYVDHKWQKLLQDQLETEEREMKEHPPLWSTVGGTDHMWNYPTGMGPRDDPAVNKGHCDRHDQGASE